jgi:hypothetical protein
VFSESSRSEAVDDQECSLDKCVNWTISCPAKHSFTLHLHLSHLADALIQSDLQIIQNVMSTFRCQNL